MRLCRGTVRKGSAFPWRLLFETSERLRLETEGIASQDFKKWRSLTSRRAAEPHELRLYFLYPGPAEHTSRKSWSALTTINADLTVDDHIANAIGILMGTSNVARSITVLGSKMVMSREVASRSSRALSNRLSLPTNRSFC